MIIEIAKITKSGQITVPKAIRKILETNIIAFEVKDDQQICVVPVRNVAGALAAYAKDKNITQDFESIRESAWQTELKRYNPVPRKRKQ